jgi:transcription initiation factor TFIIIB Brf1 subunit/transcription initiation factor TFIIB
MFQSTLSCDNCKSGQNAFKEDYNDGSIVCTHCGLVVSNILLDDRPMFRDSLESFATNMPLLDSFFFNICDKYHIPEYIAMRSIDIYNTKYKSQKNMMAARAVAFYLACQEHQLCHTVDTICNYFLVPYHQFSTILKKQDTFVVKKIGSRRFHSIVEYIVTSKEVRKPVLAKIFEFEKILVKNPVFMNKKPSKIDPIIVYFVAQEFFNLDKKSLVQDLCKIHQISIPTFKKNLAFFASILSKTR